MKKFFTFIAFISACVPAMHGMETNWPQEIPKKYDHLVTLIENVDVEAFKRAYDEAQLPSSNSLRVNAAKMETIKTVLGLEKITFETRAVVAKELEALSDSNKNWSKIVKGSLATFGGSIISLSGVIDIASCFNGKKAKETIYIIAALYTIGFPVAYKCFIYGYENLEAGLNYKQHLQDKLANLDAIATYIAQGKTQVAYA